MILKDILQIPSQGACLWAPAAAPSEWGRGACPSHSSSTLLHLGLHNLAEFLRTLSNLIQVHREEPTSGCKRFLYWSLQGLRSLQPRLASARHEQCWPDSSYLCLSCVCPRSPSARISAPCRCPSALRSQVCSSLCPLGFLMSFREIMKSLFVAVLGREATLFQVRYHVVTRNQRRCFLLPSS